MFINVRPSPFFFRLLSNVFSDFGSVGRSEKEKKRKKKKKIEKRNVEIGGPVPQHNIRGAWKQGVVTKSTWRQWTKEKSVRQKLASVSD